MRVGPSLVMAIVVGALVSTLGARLQGFHFLPVFAVLCGSALGLASLVVRTGESVSRRRARVRSDGA